ncbi:MAG: Sec-independent protein translocase protein TatB [Nevskia sp.]|jgi:sec-independent protein translocase protein TatB|nr:Sec-independent protein translocase protein TatB [Nevskia sp.]
MLDIGFSELLLCFIVALIVLGPERLPAAARGIGRWTGKARSYMRNLTAELERESHVAEFKQQVSDAKRILDDESSEMKKSFDQTASQIETETRAVAAEVQQQVAEVTQPEAAPNLPGEAATAATPVPELPTTSAEHETPVAVAGIQAPVAAALETKPPDPHV